MNNKLFEILNKNTSEKGSYSLNVNSHRETYETIEEFIGSVGIVESEYEKKYIDKCIKSDTLLFLSWYKDSASGNYRIYGSCVEDIIERVLDIIKEETLNVKQ